MLSTGHGPKNDDADAVSVAVVARTASRLTSAVADATITALPAIVEHRDDLVKTRTQIVMPSGPYSTSWHRLSHDVPAPTATASAPAVNPKLVYSYDVRNSPSGN